MFENVYIEHKTLSRICNQTAASWQKTLSGEVLALLQGEYYGTSDNAIPNYTFWCRMLVNADVKWDKQPSKLFVQEPEFSMLPKDIADVTFF